MNFTINTDLKKLIPPLTIEEKSQLESNLIADGVRDSLVLGEYLDSDELITVLIDGHNRLELADKNGLEYETTLIKFDSYNDVKEWMIKHQFGRRNLNNYQRSTLALLLEGVFQEKAKVNLADAGKNFGKGIDSKPFVISQNPIDTTKEIAIIANVGQQTISRVKKLQEKATPELKEQLEKGEVSINQAYKEVKKVEQKIKQEVLKQELMDKPKPLNLDTFDLIYLDPPWQYDFSKSTSRDIENQYPTMTLEEMKELEIPANENSVMYMWATSPKLLDALELLEHWGFNYKTNAVWDKEKIGMGYWFRGQHELLLVGTKGKFSPPEAHERLSSVIKGKRGKHSKKPVEVYQYIDDWFPFASKIEMFARNDREGWYSWGNQV